MAQMKVADETRDKLRGMKQGAETYDDVINRLMKLSENEHRVFISGFMTTCEGHNGETVEHGHPAKEAARAYDEWKENNE